MAYIFDQERNTFIDDEDKSLGNTFALIDNDELEKAIKQIDEQFGPGTTFPASELPPKENPYKDFEDRNPMAGIEDETRDYYLKYFFLNFNILIGYSRNFRGPGFKSQKSLIVFWLTDDGQKSLGK